MTETDSPTAQQIALEEQKVYERQFDPVQYYTTFYKDSNEELDALTRAFYTIYNSDKVKGTTLLEFGSGPVVHWVAGASRKFSDITFADLVEQNRKELDKWIRNDKEKLDWTAAFKAASSVEGKDEKAIEERVRKSIKNVSSCDVFKSNPLHPHKKTFDVVQSVFCLDTAAVEETAFHEGLRNLSTLVNPGGTLFLVGLMGATKYYFGPKQFPYLFVTNQFLKEAVTKAGFKDIDINVVDRINFSRPFDYSGFYLLTAQKI